MKEIVKYIKGYDINIYNILRTGYHTFLGVKNFWFIWATLICSISFALVVKSKGAALKWIAIKIIISVFIIWWIPGSKNILFMYPFFIMGYYGNYFEEKSKLQNRIIISLVVIYLVLLIFYNYNSYIYTSGLYITNMNWANYKQIGTDIYRYVIGLTGTITFFIILKLFYKKMNICSYIERLGKVSLQIYILQRFIIELYGYNKVCKDIVEFFGYNPLTKSIILFDFIITPIFTIFFAIAIERIIFVLQKIKLSKVLFGR